MSAPDTLNKHLKKPATSAEIAETAMVLAAGLGTRMRPLTNDRPKPLVEVADNNLIGHAMARLREAKLRRVVVNMHYLSTQIAEWAKTQPASPEIVLTDETDLLLDTGGGVKNALPYLGDKPFLVLNSDSFWLDGKTPVIETMRQIWRSEDMDALLLLCPLNDAVGFFGKGDFFLDPSGRISRRGDAASAPYAYAGVYLVSPELFTDAPDGAFSMNLLWDQALSKGRLYGMVLDGLWLHVGTPDAIADAETAIKDFQ